ncbi:hypothetical protein [Flavobacterium sp.]|uniref:hypothetical protein n=1 Tax=Flavobacterium sp. TaxID=239 RepID=UPI000ED9ADAA|nr:hypothetical protein [Flavobacterium sp.]HCQ12096.1 hypothetical protein [Flavobacterium sp.]
MNILKKIFSNNTTKSNLFKYVFVELDGSVRELFQNEKEYLTEAFHPNDGGRPYIKNNYNQLLLDNKIDGFLERRKVPKEINVKLVD